MKNLLKIFLNKLISQDSVKSDIKKEVVKVDNGEEKSEKSKPADFEEAIKATGFGKFNVLLLLLAIPSGWSSMFESTTMSYVIPVAHCDLELTLEQKGYLISASYLGMLSSALIWGFLSDTFGRKKVLVGGFLTTSFFTMLAGISQSLAMILFAKFMAGFIVNGPFAVLTALLSEFHCASHRARVILGMGIVFSGANIILPLLAWSLLPNPITISLFNGSFVLHSWNIFLLVSSLPSLVSGIAHIFIPESPKFLMTAGRNEDALIVFQTIYSVNSGKARDTFPIKELVEESEDNEKRKNRTLLKTFKQGFSQMKPIFFPPHRSRAALVVFIQMGTIMGLNTLRLWLPQIFQAINDYEATNKEEASICQMIQMVHPNKTAVVYNEDNTIQCEVNYENDSVYINSMIASGVSILGYLLVGSLINILGKKKVLISFGVASGVVGSCIYFSPDSVTTVSLSSLFVALAGINTNVILTIIVDLFPTTLRTTAVALSMMMARFGAMLGNLFFPHLITVGCLPPFLFVGLSTGVSALLGFFLPKTDMKALV